jgi:hypothetical protein
MLHRTLKVAIAPADIRAASFQGRQHIVFPVMACMEGVVRAMGSDAPELVRFEVLARTVGQWNGKPIVGGHPLVGGEPVSANTPDIYERETFGLIFEASANETTRKLEVRAFIDPAKADTRIARDVVDRLERAMSGESTAPIEVSIGAFVSLSEQSGVFNGKPFRRVWTDLTADHLALLESGDRGACSFEMGCGVRAAQENDDMADKSIKDRFLSLITAGFRASLAREEMTDNDLRQSLSKALHAKVPGFIDVIAVTPAQKTVVFAAAPESSMLFLETNFTLASDGTVTISDDEPTEVAPRTKFEPLMAAEVIEAARVAALNGTACGCGGKQTAAAPHAEGETMDRKSKIASLAAHKKALGRYTPKFLESLTDDQLNGLETELNALPEPEATTTTQQAPGITAEQVTQAVTTALAAARPTTMSAFLDTVPEEFRETLRSAHEVATTVKTRTIKALMDTKRCDYTEDELKAMSQPQLDKMLKLANPTPRVLQPGGGPFARDGRQDDETRDDDLEEAPSPEPMSKQFVAARAAK